MSGVLVVQHLWSRWTKQSRGAAAARPRLPETRALKPPAGPGAALWIHDFRMIEDEAFAPVEATYGDRIAYEDARPARATPLRWRRTAEAVELALDPPWPLLRRTRWPAVLPDPLARLTPGKAARVIWNARFTSSAGGSNLAYFFEEHAIVAALLDRAEPAPFAEAAADARLYDFTTKIY